MSTGDGRRDGSGLRIRRASEVLGVPLSTMRSWERRYGIPETVRSTGGHRRYPADALDQLRTMRDEVGHGRPASTAARRVRQRLDPTQPGAARTDELLAASQRADVCAIEALLDVAEDEVGLAATLDQVLIPTMREIGAAWENGRCGIAQEALTTATVRRWLARRTTAGRGAPVLLVCGVRDRHTIALEAFATLLGRRCQAQRVLGPGTTTQALVALAAATHADAVVVVSQLRSHRTAAVAMLSAVVETGCPTYYAGGAFLFPGARVAVPGSYLGESLAAAADLTGAGR